MPRQIKSVEKKIGRRGNNEWSIYQRKDDRWCAQVTVGYKEDGKLIVKYAYGSSRQEVAKKLTKYTNDVFENGYTTFVPTEVKFFVPLFEEWYTTFKESVISSSTSEKLRNFMKNHIKPEFSAVAANQVDLLRLQKFFNGLSKKGMGLQSIKHMRQLLNQFFEQYLIKQGIIKENPMSSVNIKSKERDDAERDKLALSPELRVEILAKLENEVILKPIITTLMLTGMRPGELIALRWRDIYFKACTISIKTAAGREIDFGEDGNVKERRQVISNTKTVLSVRAFIMAQNVVECLTNWLAYQKEQEIKTGIDFTAGDCYVFSQKRGEVRSYGGLRSLLRRFVSKHNLQEHEISLYTFRHTFATMLLEERENPKIVSKLMGHSKVLATLSIYSHVISKSVFVSTAKTLDLAFDKLSGQNKITDELYDSSSVI